MGAGTTGRTIDVLIRGARIVDGTGNAWFYGDVALAGDRIAEIAPPGHLPAEAAREVVDAAGMIVCPGFFDILSHSILPLMHDPRSLSKVTQGVTTEIMGEGWTPAPTDGQIADAFHDVSPAVRAMVPDWIERARNWHRIGDWLGAMVERGVSPNIGTFLGGGTLREYACGMRMGPATSDELATMRRTMAEAMEDGAFGVSYALIYPPDSYVPTEELVAVCQVVSQNGGLYITHMRSEADTLLEAIDEAVHIGREAQLPVEIYHLKAAGKPNWGKMADAIARIEAARVEGIDVTADMYPYAASGTGLDAVLPPWTAADGKFFENLRDPETRERIRAEVLTPNGEWEALAHGAGPEGVMPVGLERTENAKYIGKSLAEIASARGQHWVDSVFDLLLSEEQRIGTIYFIIDEANVRLGLRQPWVSISTDAGGLDPVWATALGPTHPRAYGTYPRVLGKYVREEGVLSLEDAVRKMSGLVASRLGLSDRGLLRPGYLADVVIFDPVTVGDRATFADSHQFSTGIRDVWINGTRVLSGGQHTSATPGRIVRGGGRA